MYTPRPVGRAVHPTLGRPLSGEGTYEVQPGRPGDHGAAPVPSGRSARRSRPSRHLIRDMLHGLRPDRDHARIGDHRTGTRDRGRSGTLTRGRTEMQGLRRDRVLSTDCPDGTDRSSCLRRALGLVRSSHESRTTRLFVHGGFAMMRPTVTASTSEESANAIRFVAVLAE